MNGEIKNQRSHPLHERVRAIGVAHLMNWTVVVIILGSLWRRDIAPKVVVVGFLILSFVLEMLLSWATRNIVREMKTKCSNKAPVDTARKLADPQR